MRLGEGLVTRLGGNGREKVRHEPNSQSVDSEERESFDDLTIVKYGVNPEA